MLEKTEGTIQNARSRDTGNIGHTRRRTNTTTHTHKKTKRMSHKDPNIKPEPEPGVRGNSLNSKQN